MNEKAEEILDGLAANGFDVRNLIHRSSLDGWPLCGSQRGRISTSGVCVTCEECRRLSAPPDRAAQLRTLEAAALGFRAGGAR